MKEEDIPKQHSKLMKSIMNFGSFLLVNVSYAVVVVSRHMTKPSKEHGNGCFGILEARVSPSGCSDLIYGYVDSVEVEWFILEQIVQTCSHNSYC